MGKTKYLKEFREHFKDRTYFSTGEVERFLKQHGASKEYARLALHNMERHDEIKRLKRGYYSFNDNLDAIGFLFEPFYYGLQEALSLHRLWGQETNPVIITTRNVRTGLRSVLGRNVLIRHIKRSMFFGYESKRIGNLFLPVSDVEKTLIDFVYFKINIPGDVLDEISKKLDRNKLNEYLKRTDERLRKKINELSDSQAVNGIKKK
jgi:predicted transcriptional regulator of viral defense system